MANGQLRTVIHQLRRLVGGRGGCTLTDAQLLEDYVTRRDEASFEVLVWRHGAMVLNLCQRVLHDTHEAEDAFQATFLVFARKASSIGKREAIGSWLYKVTYRIALRLRARAVKRGETEPADDLPAPNAADDVLWRDLRPVLDEEIDRLPEKYRTPFVLCYLQGHTNEEAAEQLGCPKGTILSRLARGRERLRSRLVRRGVALSAGCLTTLLFQNASSATVPAALVSSTAKAAIGFAAGTAVTELVSTSVVALTEGVLHTMFLTKLKILTAALLALAVLTTGAGFLTHQALAVGRGRGETGPGAPSKQETVTQRGAEENAQRPRQDAKSSDVFGKVVAVAKDGKSFTVEVPPQTRGDEPKKIEIKIGEKTAVIYLAVGPEGAKPTEGYHAQVKQAEGTKDGVASVIFQGAQNFRTPNYVGKVIAVAKDGKGITLEIGPRSRIAEGQSLEIKFTDKTVLAYSLIAKGGAKLTEGYQAEVWVEGLGTTKETIAARVNLTGMVERGTRGDKGPDVVGKVVAVSTDGKKITLEMARGREQADKIEIKLGDKTPQVFHNVGPDEAKVVVGLQARVWLEDGSKDSAAKVAYTGVVKESRTQAMGKVVGVAKDGKSFTLETAARGRGEEPKRIEIKMNDKTRLAYFGVGPNGAKPSEGYMAQVQLEEGSKDTAEQIRFSIQPGLGERGR